MKTDCYRNRRILFVFGLLLVMVFLLWGCGTAGPGRGSEGEGNHRIVTDWKGNKVTVVQRPQRILALSSTFDAILLGIVPPERVAAVSILSRDPESSFAAENARQVKEAVREYNAETLMRLQPDLVIASDWDSQDVVQTCRDLGFPVIICKGPVNFDEIRQTIRLIAAAAGETVAGESVVSQMDQVLSKADAVLAEETERAPSGLLISQMTSYGGPGSMYDSLCSRARIRNSIAEAGIHNGEPLTKEGILRAKPDFFMYSIYTKDPFGYNAFKEEFIHDPALQSLEGLHQVRGTWSRYIYCANQSCGYAVMGLANCAYGDLFDLSQEHLIKGY